MKQDANLRIGPPAYQALLGQMEKVKTRLWREFGGALDTHERLLRLALNEAEALAFLTPFPELMFPILAEEKALALERWAARQRAMWPAGRVRGFFATGKVTPPPPVPGEGGRSLATG